MAHSHFESFRHVLDHLDESDASHQLLYFRVLHAAGVEAVPELAERVRRASASRGLCQLVYESAFYYPWADWEPVLSRLLRHEPDPLLFDIGSQALGRIGDANAVASLMELARIRPVPEFQQMISGVLAKADPEQAFLHHLTGLMEGSANPRVANEAASLMEDLVNETHLEALQATVQHADLLVFRHAIRLIAQIPSRAAADCLAGLLADYHQGVLEDRELKELLSGFKGLPRVEAGQAALGQLAARLEKRDPGGPKLLPESPGAAEMATLKERVAGALETFLFRVLAAAQESSPTALGKVLGEVAEEIHLRARRLSFAMDHGAEGLAQMVKKGIYPVEEAIPLLERAIRENTGREGLIRAFALIVPAEATELLDLVIQHPDGAMRAVAVEALGFRKEEALRSTFLKACRDAITDTAHQALVHLGQLSEPEVQGRQLLQADNLVEIQLGITFIGMHGLRGLGPELLDLVRGKREEIAIKALGALARIGSLELSQVLLELLHSGQSPQLQVAMAEALRDMKIPEAALALCEKARELKNAEIHVIAAEALCGCPQPLEEDVADQLLAEVQAAWNEKNPWPLRLRLALGFKDLVLPGKEQRQTLTTLVQQALAEKRPPNVWSAEEQAKVQQIAKELAKH
ncbi:MAG: hypothetical protein H6Q00_3212 [Holophagaceae bacterium]|nr:hypothetical protein [Holophagaceae bacterium]